MLRGGYEIYERVKDKLGIDNMQVTLMINFSHSKRLNVWAPVDSSYDCS
jgi:hypothetical protein